MRRQQEQAAAHAAAQAAGGRRRPGQQLCQLCGWCSRDRTASKPTLAPASAARCATSSRVVCGTLAEAHTRTDRRAALSAPGDAWRLAGARSGFCGVLTDAMAAKRGEWTPLLPCSGVQACTQDWGKASVSDRLTTSAERCCTRCAGWKGSSNILLRAELRGGY